MKSSVTASRIACGAVLEKSICQRVVLHAIGSTVHEKAVVTAVPPKPSGVELRVLVDVGVMRLELPLLSNSVSATEALLMPVPAEARFITTSVGLRGALGTPPMIMIESGPVGL